MHNSSIKVHSGWLSAVRIHHHRLLLFGQHIVVSVVVVQRRRLVPFEKQNKSERLTYWKDCGVVCCLDARNDQQLKWHACLIRNPTYNWNINFYRNLANRVVKRAGNLKFQGISRRFNFNRNKLNLGLKRTRKDILGGQPKKIMQIRTPSYSTRTKFRGNKSTLKLTTACKSARYLTEVSWDHCRPHRQCLWWLAAEGAVAEVMAAVPWPEYHCNKVKGNANRTDWMPIGMRRHEKSYQKCVHQVSVYVR